MRFLADENVWKSLVAELTRRDHDVVRVCDVEAGGTDEAVLARADAEKRILLTEDKDFGHLVFGREKGTAGVVLVLFSRFRADPQAVVQTIADAIETQGSALVGAVTVIAPDRIRRKMP